MKKIHDENKETSERVEFLKAEGGRMLMSMESEKAPAPARLRLIDEKMKSLLRQSKRKKVNPS